MARVLFIALAIAGGLSAPLFASATMGELSNEGRAILEGVQQRMKPREYEPGNAPGCMRQQGRAYLARVRSMPPTTSCVGACQVKLVDIDGTTARYEVSGAFCGAQGGGGTQARYEPPVAPPSQPEGPARAARSSPAAVGPNAAAGEAARQAWLSKVAR